MRTACLVVGLSLVAGTAVAKPKALADFLPAKLGDIKREPPSRPDPLLGDTSGGVAHAAYLLPERRFVNINLMWAQEPAAERAEFVVHRPGETKESQAAGYEGFDVDGLFVQRTSYTRSRMSEVRAVLADRIVVRLSVENAKEPNEPLEWLRKMDLQSLTAFARKAPAPKRARK